MSVVSRQESGLRGYQAMLAKHGVAQVNKWRRTGGRKRNRTYLEIIEAERLEAEAKASARRARRSSSRGRQPITDSFDSIS